MNPKDDGRRLAEVFESLGLSLYDGSGGLPEGGTAQPPDGFPVWLPSAEGEDGDGRWVVFRVPPALEAIGQDRCGCALLDARACVIRSWGVIRNAEPFSQYDSGLDSPIATGLDAALSGSHSEEYHDGIRYWMIPVDAGGEPMVMVYAFSAAEEEQARRDAERHAHSADALRRIGRALNQEQTPARLVTQSVHAINSAMELAAVLLWLRDDEADHMELSAHVGVRHDAERELQRIDIRRGTSCVAELAVARTEPIIVPNVHTHPLTAEIEARFCNLAPGGMMAIPLRVGSRLTGVLELVGRSGDKSFSENRDLYVTIAEHLALALNSAAMFEQAERQATYDSLTGIANHRAMQEFLSSRLHECDRSNGSLAVIMLDVDHFRNFNEEEGHDAGDEVLKLVAGVLKTALRPYDLAARYGGEEFALIMPNAPRHMVPTIAERIRKQIAELEYSPRQGRTRSITASLGCAVYPDDGADAAALLKAADLALFEAKRAGRNRSVMFEQRLLETSQADQTRDAVLAAVPKRRRSAGRRIVEQTSLQRQLLSDELNLSERQRELLEAGLVAMPYLAGLSGSARGKWIANALRDGDLRGIAPSWTAAFARYDGVNFGVGGSHMPLIGRILAVLWAWYDHPGELDSDPDRFDPEVLAALGRLQDAA